jgi:hypothetical protein
MRAALASSRRGGRWTKKFTAKGRLVCARAARTSASTVSRGMTAAPIDPSPPALETADAIAAVVIDAIGAWMMG